MAIFVIVISSVALVILTVTVGVVLYSAKDTRIERTELTKTISEHADTLNAIRTQCRTEETELRTMMQETLEAIHREHA